MQTWLQLVFCFVLDVAQSAAKQNPAALPIRRGFGTPRGGEVQEDIRPFNAVAALPVPRRRLTSEPFCLPDCAHALGFLAARIEFAGTLERGLG